MHERRLATIQREGSVMGAVAVSPKRSSKINAGRMPAGRGQYMAYILYAPMRGARLCFVVVASNSKVVAACFEAIFVIAFSSKETQGRLSSLGVCERVVQAMGTHMEDLEVQARGCGAIYALSLSNKQTQLRLCQAKAPAACLNALHRYMDDPSTALSAADAFMSMSCDNKLGQDLLGSGEGAGAELNGKGACELLADLVDRYENDRDVMYAGLDAVMKLAIDNPENRLRFGAAGMCRKVMDAFEQYQDDEIFLLVRTGEVVKEGKRDMQHAL